MLLRIFAFTMIALGLTGTALAARVALVIGNADYEFASPLANPLNDAGAVSRRLQEIGFEVDFVENLTGGDARRTLGRFAAKSRKADIALVYYAGHGIELSGRNFLIPVDARMESEAEAEFEAIPLDDLVRTVEGAGKLGLVMLDACRDNPFAATMLRNNGTRSLSRGLAPVEVRSPGLLISFAAEAGRTAADGKGEHSPYTQALLDTLAEPGLEIGFMFRKMRGRVRAATDGQQTPIEHMQLPDEEIYLVPPGDAPAAEEEVAVVHPAPAPEPTGPTNADALAAALDVNTRRGWELLLRNFGYDAVSGLKAFRALENLGLGSGPDAGPEQVEASLTLSAQQRRDVQASLNDVGLDVGTPDGVWGRKTRGGIREVQKQLGREETGFVDLAVLEHLGVMPGAANTDTFINSEAARRHNPDALKLLGEDRVVVETLNCLGSRRSVYGRSGDSYYFVVIGSVPVTEHAANFERCGGYLASITSEGENDFIHDMIRHEIEFFDIGFDDNYGYSYKAGPFFGMWQDPVAREPHGGWRWRNGEPIGYTNWRPNTPNENREGQNFAQFHNDRKGAVDMTDVETPAWFDANGQWTRSAVMEVSD